MSILRATCAHIERERKVLVAQRPEGKALAGKWEFPGAKIDTGESPEACLVREIQEELGCDVAITASLPSVTHSYPKRHIELIPFRCRLKLGEPLALEHSVIEWLDPLRLSEIDLADTDRPIFEEYLKFRSAPYGTSS